MILHGFQMMGWPVQPHQLFKGSRGQWVLHILASLYIQMLMLVHLYANTLAYIHFIACVDSLLLTYSQFLISIVHQVLQLFSLPFSCYQNLCSLLSAIN